MNVCHDDGPVVAFRDHWQSRYEPRAESHDASWIAYCRVREREERACAKRAHSIEARRIHQELAQSYARLIGEASDA